MDYEESSEDIITVVKLINRETGKVVTRVNADALKLHGQTIQYESIDKESAPYMEKLVTQKLNKLSKLSTTIKADGINPGQLMPQFFTGDVIYVEEPTTGIVGGYYIRNVTHEFVSDDLVKLSFDVATASGDIPKIEEDQAEIKGNTKAKKATEKSGVAAEYSAEMKAVLDKYGL